ncbi:MAG: hypothetical protein GY696_21095, partial [Gammaproteobacteria bacterium]|nr:hypothetical protein [Gammaproteobacteria bacterium]
MVTTASPHSISDETRDDEDMQMLLEAVQHQQWVNLQLSGPAAKVYKEVRKELNIKDGVLYCG